MGIKSNVSKMFNVLVVGGAMMASVNLSADDGTKCNLELHDQKTGFTQVTCLDDFDQNESLSAILKEIEDEKGLDCITPFCGCWLG